MPQATNTTSFELVCNGPVTFNGADVSKQIPELSYKTTNTSIDVGPTAGAFSTVVLGDQMKELTVRVFTSALVGASVSAGAITMNAVENQTDIIVTWIQYDRATDVNTNPKYTATVRPTEMVTGGPAKTVGEFSATYRIVSAVVKST